ncbi:hypothetical protein [Streptomyces noursei]|uniref:hypothetical protein n=2 Tax=Streptomyces TaxID=1883 RepID=UPI0030F42A80
MKKSLRAAVLAGATAALAFASVAVTAPTASAVGSSACTRKEVDKMHSMGPATPIHESPYGSSKVVTGGWRSFSTLCSKPGHDGHRWWYGYVASGQEGWVWGAYLET